MLEMTNMTAAFVSGSLGLIAGILIATGVFYFFTYSKIHHKNAQLRDACLLYQKQLTQLLNKNKALESQLREAKSFGDGKATKPDGDAEPDGASNAQFAPLGSQPRILEQHDLTAQIDHLHQEKLVLEQSLEQATGRWKEERGRLIAENQQLKTKIESSVGDQGSVDPAGVSDLDHERQVLGWKRAQHLLQQQIGKLKGDKKALETELVSQAGQAEREKQALEDEIELLTERLMKLLDPDTGTVAASPSPVSDTKSESLPSVGADVGTEANASSGAEQQQHSDRGDTQSSPAAGEDPSPVQPLRPPGSPLSAVHR